jgi:FixJ family two-component response regulator
LGVREREVVRLLALGYAFAAIARMMSFNERTVKNYRASPAAAFGLRTRGWAHALGAGGRSARRCAGAVGLA